jgi:hypothetical protein
VPSVREVVTVNATRKRGLQEGGRAADGIIGGVTNFSTKSFNYEIAIMQQ